MAKALIISCVLIIFCLFWQKQSLAEGLANILFALFLLVVIKRVWLYFKSHD